MTASSVLQGVATCGGGKEPVMSGMGETTAIEQSFQWMAFELFDELVKIYEYEDASESEDILAEVLRTNPVHSQDGRPFSQVLREAAGAVEPEVTLVLKGDYYQAEIMGIEDTPIMVTQLRKSSLPKKAYPPLLTQAASLVGTAARATMQAAKTGRVLAPEEVVRERWELCYACDSWDEEKGRCRECGCYSKAKNTLAEASCPLQKWGPYKEHEDGTDRSTST